MGFEKEVWQSQIVDKAQDDAFAQHLYASLCNTPWRNKQTGDMYTCSWRYAGGFVASLREKGEDYLDFYCSGGEGLVHPDVYKELNALGYEAITYEEYDRLNEEKELEVGKNGHAWCSTCGAITNHNNGLCTRCCEKSKGE